jgi:hypothetical protein
MKTNSSGVSVQAGACTKWREVATRINPRACLLTLVLACFLAGNAWAGPRGWPHGHPRSSVQFGVYVGVPWVYPPFGYYPPPIYYPRVYVPPVAPVVVVPTPPVYIEQSGIPPASPVLETGYWYYCSEAQAYYPYVKQCPGGWQQVAPQPPQ